MNLSPVLKLRGEWLAADTAAKCGLVLADRTENGVRRVALENLSVSVVRPEELGWGFSGVCPH